jgi:DNA end-binding protein Ku
MFSASQSSNLDLDMLDSKDHSNIRFRRVNEKTGKEVKWENIVKGYRLENDDYVILNDEDFAKAAAEKNKRIEIKEFVDLQEIDTVYYETPYYLAPGKNGEHAYGLLREALEKTGKAGLATFVMRNKETLAIIKSDEDVIVLERIRFAEEIRSTEEIAPAKAVKVKPDELKMAVTLIKQLSGKFNISRYKDTYTAELLKLIKAKSKGVKYRTPKMKVVHGKSKDIMSQLKASLRQSKAS